MLEKCLFTLVLIFSFSGQAMASESGPCALMLMAPKPLVPREVDPEKSFNALVDWIHQDLVVKKKAPGFVLGISGTDSILVFLAAAKAFEKEGRPGRVAGIHYAPNIENVLVERRGESDFWFQREVIPWLKAKAPGAQIIVDSSINGKRDGLRWGALMDFSVLQDYDTGVMRPPRERYWILGTRNATEEALRSYSNLSREVSAHVLTPFWKSEVLKICAYLQVPQGAMQRSCEADCACGRDQLPAINIPEVDALLMIRKGDLDSSYAEATIPPALRKVLESYIESQIQDTAFKTQIPYLPPKDLNQKVVEGLSTELKELIADWRGDDIDIQKLSRLVPRVLESESGYVSQLFSVFDNEWMPEALILLKHQSLRTNQLENLLKKVYSVKDLSVPEMKRLAALSGRIGDYAFSFPQWRFATQPSRLGLSMAEDFGFIRIRRSDDVRDALIPLSDPARDEYGSGLLLDLGKVLIEYRRAYVLVSEKTEKGRHTLVIRNSSCFFGRDRLPEAAYVTFENWSYDELLTFGKARMQGHHDVIPLHKLMKVDLDLSRSERIHAVARLLDHLDKVNLNFSEWLLKKEMGLSRLMEFVKTQSEKSPDRQPFVGVVRGSAPTWKPLNVRKMDQSLLLDLETKSADEIFPALKSGSRFIMMSGPQGDFP